MYEIGRLLISLLNLLELLVFINIILSWVLMFGGARWRYHPVVRFLDKVSGAVVEPLLAPIRNVLRPYTRDLPIDFSPLVLLIGIQIVQSLIRSAILQSL